MTPEKDLPEAARIIDEMAAQAAAEGRSDAALLHALSLRLRRHAKQPELRSCRDALFRACRRVQDLTSHMVAAGLEVPPQAPGPGPQPTPPPPATAGV